MVDRTADHIRRGSVWWADLREPTGSTPGFRRPVLVVSSDVFNAGRIRTVVVAALTSNARLADMPGNVRVSAGEIGLPRDSVLNASQLVTLDRALLLEYVGQVRPRTLARVDDGLRLVLDL